MRPQRLRILMPIPLALSPSGSARRPLDYFNNPNTTSKYKACPDILRRLFLKVIDMPSFKITNFVLFFFK
jgi:hypothetical protein